MPPRWCWHHLGHPIPNFQVANSPPQPPWQALVGKHWGLIQGKEGGIQLLAGLAPPSQTVGSNMRISGATSGGSCKAPFLPEASLACQGPPFLMESQSKASGCENVWQACKEDLAFLRPSHQCATMSFLYTMRHCRYFSLQCGIHCINLLKCAIMTCAILSMRQSGMCQ
jgi:hypothetical protein